VRRFQKDRDAEVLKGFLGYLHPIWQKRLEAGRFALLNTKSPHRGEASSTGGLNARRAHRKSVFFEPSIKTRP
jgi:hypothetical protein